MCIIVRTKFSLFMATTHLLYPYPASPAHVDPAALEPSPAFKQQVVKVAASIAWFMVVYVLLLVLAGLLAAGTLWLGLAIIVGMASLLGLLLGGGIMLLGVLIVWFLIKFIFKVQRHNTDNLQPITEKEYPALFDFLRKLTTETGTAFPKKVFLSSEVNAYVFYNSSFWSMFFPVRKNLVIGLGLVNAINVSEFKAVMAHEFGHFSQRSMKLGSYVYQVNRMLHNMLYDNAGYSKVLEKVASVSNILALFAQLTAYIVGGIQQILQYMYGLINKGYMGLSRQMEFHADAVAASVSGGNHLISALRRLELADAAWNRVVQQYNMWIPQSKQGGNAFTDMHTVTRHLQQTASIDNAPDGLPHITDNALASTHSARVNVENQWASHPERTDREAYLHSLGWTTEARPESAWQLFDRAAQLQAEATQLLFKEVQWEKETEVQTDAAFQQALQEEEQYYSFPALYHGYYNSRLMVPFDVAAVLAQEAPAHTNLDTILTPALQNINGAIQYLQKDVELLTAIAEGQLTVKTFDLDGTKYDAGSAADCKARLEKELEALLEQRARADAQIAALVLHRCAAPSVEAERYRHAFAYWETANAYRTEALATHKRLEPLLQGQTFQIEDANILANYLRTQHVPTLKAEWEELKTLGLTGVPEAVQEQAASFFSKQYLYLFGNSFLDEELKALLSTLQATYDALEKGIFETYKALLRWQADVLEG